MKQHILPSIYCKMCDVLLQTFVSRFIIKLLFGRMLLHENRLVHKGINCPLYSVNKTGNQISVSGISYQIKCYVTD
jgi:hypothetical protein